MLRSSKAISLVLVGTATALLGYEAVAPSRSPFYQDGADFDNGYSSTQPTGRTSGSGYYGSHYYHPSSSRGFFSSWFGSSSYNGNSGGGSSSHVGGTARGGFGASGHAAGS